MTCDGELAVDVDAPPWATPLGKSLRAESDGRSSRLGTALALESGCRIFTSCASYSEPAFGFTTGLDVGSVTTVTASDWSAGFFSKEIQFIFFYLSFWLFSISLLFSLQHLRHWLPLVFGWVEIMD